MSLPTARAQTTVNLHLVETSLSDSFHGTATTTRTQSLSAKESYLKIFIHPSISRNMMWTGRRQSSVRSASHATSRIHRSAQSSILIAKVSYVSEHMFALEISSWVRQHQRQRQRILLNRSFSTQSSVRRVRTHAMPPSLFLTESKVQSSTSRE